MKKVLCLALLACTACAEDRKIYAGLEFLVDSTPPVPASIEPDRIEVPAGVAVKVTVEPLSSERSYDDDDLLVLRAEDEDVLAVYPGEGFREFVFVGLEPGDTCLEVKLNRRERECIDVRVLADGE